MHRKTLVLALATLAVAALAIPLRAVNDGEPDAGRHPYVGLMVAQDASGRPLWRCSGTLLSATVYLTAGHCTEAPAAHVEIWFQEDVESGIPGNGYPFTGNVGGTPHTHHNIRVRLLARSKLNQINTGFTGDFSMLLSNNAHTGGTCFGDSGGPNFVGDTAVIAGVTSFGINGDCAGTGGVYRIDGV